MPDNMRAFVMKQVGEVAVVDKPIPEPGPNEAVVRTTTALVCTSDVHTVKGAIPIEPNRTLGHEAVGVVHTLGSAVQGFSPGDRVAVGAITPCFTCDYCQRGFTSQCQGMLGGYKFTGQRDGNMAEYFVVNDAQANLTPIPDELPDEKAVYATDMLSTGFAGAENAELRRDGGHLRPGPCRPVSNNRLPAARRRPDLCGGEQARAAEARPAIRRRRHHRLHQG
jgi:threonine dehydrogenase-like Zn-dependent dehydrogenase